MGLVFIIIGGSLLFIFGTGYIFCNSEGWGIISLMSLICVVIGIIVNIIEHKKWDKEYEEEGKRIIENYVPAAYDPDYHSNYIGGNSTSDQMTALRKAEAAAREYDLSHRNRASNYAYAAEHARVVNSSKLYGSASKAAANMARDKAFADLYK